LKKYTLGLSYGYHDSAAALLVDGKIVAAIQEERFSRVKQDTSFPINALRSCLHQGSIDLARVDDIFYYENPNKKISRIAATYLNHGFSGYGSFVQDFPRWVFDKWHVKSSLRRQLRSLGLAAPAAPPIHYIDHHLSHAAAAFFPSPFDRAAILCIDGVGEWATTSAWVGHGNRIEPVWEVRFPHSLGLLYSAVTYFCGFKVDSGEYKLMGLAPYGRPIYYEKMLEHLIDLREDGSFWLNMSYFDYAVGNCMVSSKFENLFGGPRRMPESIITEREFDLAASIQRVLETALLRIGHTLRKQTGEMNLCMAGGVALNCVANGKLMAADVFDRIWVQPAAGDSGGALGAALAGWHLHGGGERTVSMRTDSMQNSLLGSSYTDGKVELALDSFGAVFEKVDPTALCARVAEFLSQGQVVGWFQGRMEFGPRSLGSRSILGDPRNVEMQSVMNLKIKDRESFRPFAPAVLEEHTSDWFELEESSPYMLFVVNVRRGKCHEIDPSTAKLTGMDLLKRIRSDIPAVTHIDYSARVQTVDREHSNARFRELLEAFYALTACPVLVNTSFNVRGEPIVESPRDAYRCFMRTQMDTLVIGNYVLHKQEQPPFHETGDWRGEFALD
jgi:carbamoyltransferase